MKPYRRVRTALHALRRNIMRAVLTCLGIIIGVGAVIAMMEIGQGSAVAIQRTIASMGANNLMIMPGTAASGGVSFGVGSVMTLSPDDAAAIVRDCPAVRNTAPVVRARAQVVYGNRNWVPMSIYGTTPAFLDVREWPIGEGESFTDRDVRNQSKVAVIGQTLVRELFGGRTPVGKEIRIQNVSFRVIGVLRGKGANMMGMDQDDIVLAPWTTVKYRVTGTSSSAAPANASSTAGATAEQQNTLKRIYPGSGTKLYPEPSAAQQANSPLPVRFTNVDQILVAARSGGQTAAAEQQITRVLRERHRLADEQPEDFTIRNMAEIMRTLSSTSTLMTTLLLVVAAISLVVGGVGIMNIMLVSVTERTREIGLRMAVGARGRDILYQFLLESVLLCLAGGALGIGLGRGASYVVTQVLGWPTASSVLAVAAAVAVAASVGILFGFYPAWKASRLDPIEALRYE